MKNFRLLTLLILVIFGEETIAAEEALSTVSSEEEEESFEIPGPAYSINNSSSTLYWEGSKPGGKHHGTIEVINGTASTSGESITGGSFNINMTSIRNDDVNNAGMRKRLVDHLKSDDFFHVDKYPESFFVISEVKALDNADKETESTHMVRGDLTIRGITHEISFPAEITMDDQSIYARTGNIRLDRTRWSVNHKSRSLFAELKDSYIDDEMIVRLDLSFDRD